MCVCAAAGWSSRAAWSSSPTRASWATAARYTGRWGILGVGCRRSRPAQPGAPAWHCLAGGHLACASPHPPPHAAGVSVASFPSPASPSSSLMIPAASSVVQTSMSLTTGNTSLTTWAACLRRPGSCATPRCAADPGRAWPWPSLAPPLPGWQPGQPPAAQHVLPRRAEVGAVRGEQVVCSTSKSLSFRKLDMRLFSDTGDAELE